MRTRVVLDANLVVEALALVKAKSKRGLVEQALKEFIASRKRLDIRKLRGTGGLCADYDYSNTRA